MTAAQLIFPNRVVLQLAVVFACAVSAGCSDDEKDSDTKSGASADVAGLGANTGVTGAITFSAASGGVAISGTVSGLAPNSTHGFHLHQMGDCSSADGMSAGGHWNPKAQVHGAPTNSASHLGDLGNIEADANGVASISLTKAGATVGGGAETDVIGRAVIVHADADDQVTDPTGNAGARIACGVVR